MLKILTLALVLLTACVTETRSPIATEVAGEQPLIEDDVAVQKYAMILCVNQKTFKKAVGEERLKFYGVIPTIDRIILEIYTGASGFTIAIRDSMQDEVCIMAAGSELVPVAWSIQSGLVAHSE